MRHTLNQFYEAMTFLYGGLVMGIVYELLALIRRLSGSRAAETVCDALFALLFTLAVAACFLIATGGALRLYGLAVMLLGWLIARWAFQPALRVL